MKRQIATAAAAWLAIGTMLIPTALASDSAVKDSVHAVKHSSAGRPSLYTTNKKALDNQPSSATGNALVTHFTTNISAIHDALTLTELQAVKNAATDTQNLTGADWKAIVYPSESSISASQQAMVQALNAVIHLFTFGSAAVDGENVQQSLTAIQAAVPQLNPQTVYRLYMSFLASIGGQSKTILAGQTDSQVMAEAWKSAVTMNPDILILLQKFGITPDGLGQIWSAYESRVDSSGAAQSGFLTRVVTNYLKVGAPTGHATVTVNAASSTGTIPTTAFGINAAVWDSGLENPTLISLTKALAPDLLRYPGGSISDNYDWETNTRNDGGYVNPDDTFDHFMTFAHNTGSQPIITVNYGTGTPAEAAAWVKYANVTNHYNVKYWEIGNEIYGNGYYNGNGWEADDHAVQGKPEKGNPGLSPQTYASNAEQYIQQMKAQDPSIQIGAVLTMPYNWPWGATVNGNDDWNSTVLKAIGKDIDFVDVHWYPESPGQETDAGLLADTDQIPAMITELRKEIDEYAGSNAKNVQIFVTETNNTSSTPGQQSNNLVNALYLADDLTGFVQAGVQNVDWWDLLNSAGDGYNSPTLYGQNLFGDEGLLSSGQTSPKGAVEPPADTPLPTYYGYQMVADFAKPGDTMLGTLSSASEIDTHAVKLPNGDLSLMLVNRDPSNIYDVSLNLEGYSPALIEKSEIYGEGSPSVTNTAQLPFTNTVKLPPYSVTDLLLKPALPGVTKQQISDHTTISASSIAAGQTETITSTFTNHGGYVPDATLDLEVYDATGDLVAQQIVPHVSLPSGGSKEVTWNWVTPNNQQTFTVEAYAFSAIGGLVYDADRSAATFAVTPPPLTKYGDIVATNTEVTVSGADEGTYNIPDNNGQYQNGPTIKISPGDTVTITTTFKNVSSFDFLQNAILDMEIDPGAFQYFTQSNNLAPGQTITLTKTWIVPSSLASGNYELGFQADNNNSWGGSNNCYYQPNVATFAMTNTNGAKPAAKYGDIVTGDTTIRVNDTVYNVPAPDSSGHYPSGTSVAVHPGDTVTITTTFKNVSSSDYLQDGLLDIEVDDSSGAAFQQTVQHVTLNPNDTKTVSVTWNVPSSQANGTYSMVFQAFDNSDWTGNCYYTNGGVADVDIG
ncbi:alpha-L-arabinofuranosidase [Alicyclobacillus sacchari]|uniref:Alpha-L-arabinofuranosidase n=1 Tax=Alicyclobacillus sacchari TaxID=392010 RepID=A0A4R8LLR5_9BACL|nr:alpha-L-arabinofuranosidase [Alicyclobacillus sacchari]TDY46241.1 alpha-L-arabinofuranosidase [Alicyclobacillus sacchari]